MQKLAVLTGAAALYLGLVTLLRKQIFNTALLATIATASLITVIGIHTRDTTAVAVTHYLFIFLVYLGCVFATGYALALIAILSALAFVTRVYYNKCIFADAYRDAGERTVVNDLTYIAPLVVIALRTLG